MPKQRMELVDAVVALKGDLAEPQLLAAAFQDCLALRRGWLVADLLDYRDLITQQGPDLPPAAAWVVDVDPVAKPKQSGGTRVERFADVFTCTLLQGAANRLRQLEPQADAAADVGFTALRVESARSYEAWAREVAGWVTQRLAMGLHVVTVDFADFFSCIQPEQIERSLAATGLGQDTVRAILALFDCINAPTAGDGCAGRGLPTIPDDIAWHVADLVLHEFDADVARLPGIRDYARWVDDCFVACDSGSVASLLQALGNRASAIGLRLNSNKTRVLRDPADLDRALHMQEHALLNDLLAVAAAGGAREIDVAAFLPKITSRLDAGGVEAVRLVKRLFALASATCSTELIRSADAYLRDYPPAERQILAYLAALGWPDAAQGILVRSLAGDGFDSRQLVALRLLLATETGSLPPAARDACLGIARGTMPAHPFARTLAFAVTMDDVAHGPRMQRCFAESVGSLQSAMARRVGLQLLMLNEGARVDWPTHLNDASPLVRRFAAFASERIAARAAQSVPVLPPCGGWNGLRKRVQRQLDCEVA